MVIRHIVLLKFKVTTTATDRLRLVSELRRLAEEVEGILRFEVHDDILHLEESFDLGLFITFRDEESLRHYGENERRQAIGAFARSLCDQVVLFDYRMKSDHEREDVFEAE
jgi:quinol monooxygenase YgiN